MVKDDRSCRKTMMKSQKKLNGNGVEVESL